MKNTEKKKVIDYNNKKQAGIAAVFVGIFAVIGVSYLIFSKAATVGPNLGFYMTTTNAAPAIGSQIDVALYANTGTTPVKSVAALVNFDPTQVTQVAASAAPAADPLANPPVVGFDVTFACGPANGCRTDSGKVAFGLTNTGTNRRSGDGIYIGTIRFTVLKAGPLNIKYDPSNTLTGFLNPDGTTQTTLDGRQIQDPTIVGADTTAPTVPTGLSSPSKTLNSVSLSWTASTDNVAVAGYRVYTYKNGTQVGNTLSVAGTTATINGLTPNTAYTFAVSAYDTATPTANESAKTSQLPVTTTADTTAPSVPTNITAGTSTFSSIAMTWTGSTDNDTTAAITYTIYRNGVQVGTSSTASFTDSTAGLLPSTSYNYTVTASDSATPTPNTSAQSAVKALSTAADSQAPTLPTLTVTKPTTTSAGVSWTASTDNDTASPITYRIYRNGTLYRTLTSPTTSFTDTGLTPGTYSYTVAAGDRTGNFTAQTAPKSITIYSPKDLNSDGIIGIGDFNLVLANYGLPAGTGLAGDANGDNVVNINDITALLQVWGTAG